MHNKFFSSTTLIPRTYKDHTAPPSLSLLVKFWLPLKNVINNFPCLNFDLFRSDPRDTIRNKHCSKLGNPSLIYWTLQKNPIQILIKRFLLLLGTLGKSSSNPVLLLKWKQLKELRIIANYRNTCRYCFKITLK